jgi:hypothetical protein
MGTVSTTRVKLTPDRFPGQWVNLGKVGSAAGGDELHTQQRTLGR